MKYLVKLVYIYEDIEANSEEEAIDKAAARKHSSNDCYWAVNEEGESGGQTFGGQND